MQFASQQPGKKAEEFEDDLNLTPPEEEDAVIEGDWQDEEDEDFDDKMEFNEDMREIRTGDDIGEPDPEDADHMPNGDQK